jgi:hypothetical protein
VNIKKSSIFRLEVRPVEEKWGRHTIHEWALFSIKDNVDKLNFLQSGNKILVISAAKSMANDLGLSWGIIE